jgi:eukaryotic-like serine/threonine-protein kinase
MESERWRRITRVFHGALARTVASRPAFLDEACADDPTLRAEVDALLVADRDAGGFSNAPLATSRSEAFPQHEPAVSRPQPFRYVVALIAAATAAAFMYGAVSLASRRGPSVGWADQQRHRASYVGFVDPNGPAAGQLKRGDRILALNGVAPAPGPGVLFLLQALRIGDHYTLAIERDGIRYDARLAVVSDGRVLARRSSYFLISLVWCGVGLFIGFARPDRATARFACLGAAGTGLVYLIAAVLQAGPSWGPVHTVVGYQFFCRFPSDRRPGRVARWTTWALYAIAIPAAVLGCALTSTLFLFGPIAGTRLVSDHDALFPLFRGSFTWVTYCSAFFAMVVVTWYNYSRVEQEDARRRVRWVAFGSLAALVPQVYSAAVAAFTYWFGPTRTPTAGWLIDIVDVAIPLSVAYAVVRHRVFDISVVVRRGLQYLLARRALQALIAVPIVAMAYTIVVNRHQTVAQLTIEHTGYLYWCGAAAVTLRFRRPIRGWLDRRFFREEYDCEQILLRLLDTLSASDSVPEMSRLIGAELESALHPKGLYLWYRESEQLTLSYCSGIAREQLPPPSEALIAWLESRNSAAAISVSMDAGISHAERASFLDAGVVLIIPVVDSASRLTAVVMLGEKRSEEPYTAGDRRLLEAIAKQASLAGDNLRLRAQVSDEQRIRRDVLSHLDRGGLDLLKECPHCGACYDGGPERCAHDGCALTLSLPISRTIENRYRLDALIAKGGMGAVYAARDLRLERIVAVKILLPSAFGRPASLRRFSREARAAARLRHPNIVSVHDVGSLDDGGAYLVMEHVSGITLRSELNRSGALLPSAAARWFIPLLDGLAAAHANGIVHRDLKPENVMGCREGASLSVKILDFGLAKILADEAPMSATLDGAAMGTSGYMSPEQILGREVDARTDIFAVGVMLAEALTGSHPFTGPTRGETARAALEREYHLPPEAAALDAVLQRCLAKSRDERFSSAADLRDALVPVLHLQLT